jgi:threo-3-hydroxy-L-aspartate ammonia-lyase
VPELVSLREIRAAASRIDGVVTRTPLLLAPRLRSGLLLKPESLQPTGSYKLRGAYAAITASLEAARNRGVVAHSSGNHGHAIAYAAAQLGVKAVVVVPENAPDAKVAPITRYGAELVWVAPTLRARQAATQELVAERGYEFIPPFDDRRVIAGQGTIGLEIAADCDPGLVVVPVSGGGLISGIAAAVTALNPGTTVVGVEPELAADARDSLRNGRRVAWPAADVSRTVADALRAEQIGELPFAHMRKLVSAIVTVTEDEIFAAMAALARDAGLVAEPGGAVAVAACLFHADELPEADCTVAVVSGGNVDPALLARALAG